MIEPLARVVGAPVVLEELKHKPGRRRTLRARGCRRTAIVKRYASGRAPVVAARVAALARGPAEPVVPEVLHLDVSRRLVVLSEVPGAPLRRALLAGELAECARAGAALGAWHRAWWGAAPSPLGPHTVERELAILAERRAGASPATAAAVEEASAGLAGAWAPSTVVHRDLYEEQLLVGERIGLIDLDDAALGPPELDLGNLLAHAELLGRRRGRQLGAETAALLDGYRRTGPPLDDALLERCRRLALLRLACLNDDASLVRTAVTA